jgi:hypothetical protein
MKNFKGIVLLVALFAINNVVIGAQRGPKLNQFQQGEINLARFINEDSRGFFDEKGVLQFDWLNEALIVLLNGAPLTRDNKDSVKRSLADAVEMVGAIFYSQSKRYSDVQITQMLPRLRVAVNGFVDRQPLGR